MNKETQQNKQTPILPEVFLTREQTQKLLAEAHSMGPTNDFISALTTVLNKFYIKTLAERPERIW